MIITVTPISTRDNGLHVPLAWSAESGLATCAYSIITKAIAYSPMQTTENDSEFPGTIPVLLSFDTFDFQAEIYMENMCYVFYETDLEICVR